MKPLEIVNAIIADGPDFFLGSDVEKPVKKSQTREHSVDYDFYSLNGNDSRSSNS